MKTEPAAGEARLPEQGLNQLQGLDNDFRPTWQSPMQTSSAAASGSNPCVVNEDQGAGRIDMVCPAKSLQLQEAAFARCIGNCMPAEQVLARW